MVFDGPGAKLPIARLRPSPSRARHRVLAAEIDRWLAARWAWVRPRTVPLLAAVLGLLVTLGAVKYVTVYAYREAACAHAIPTYLGSHATERGEIIRVHARFR